MTDSDGTFTAAPDQDVGGEGRPRPSSLFIVALGASAGGLEALERFFANVSPRTGMAFVVVQHLSPDFKSLMDDILSRRTTMAVRVAEHGAVLEPNCVYLNPPKKLIGIRDGRLQLSEKEPSPTVTYPIDHLFHRLAAEAPSRCAAIVLSGTGSDGSRGVVEVHRAGGLVIAQAPATAGFDGMPRATIDTGSADLVLSPEDMPAALRSFVDAGRVLPPPGAEIPASGLGRVVALLHEAYGVDFAEYKLPTIARRTERRVKACGAIDLEAYVTRLEADPKELDVLYRDLLIGVTQFFRDPEAFEALGRLLPPLLRALAPGEEFRLWIAGCASGEEAYSMAILVRETMEAQGVGNPVKIFATDIHREALRIAATGVYDDASLAMLSPERRERYFLDKGNGVHQIAPAIRAMVVFAVHDVLRDVPFNKLDVVSCRNLLIYLQPSAQSHVLDVFHFGLKSRGVMFLGSSESLGEQAEDFEVVDAHWKLFRKVREARPATRLRATANVAPPRPRLDALVPIPLRPAEPAMFGTYDAMLDALVPPSILIDAQRNLVQTFGGASSFLHVPEGRVTRSAIDMLDDDLRVAVTGALQRVFAEHAPVHYTGLRIGRGEQASLVDLTVREIVNRRTGEAHALVTFDTKRPASAETAGDEKEVAKDQLSRDQVAGLESELRIAKENLQTTIEELATSNEELQATNEELVASNEELQTTNEELHSVNQELFTVNSEFQRKIGELTQLTTDMDLLLSSTEVHTLFLDRELRIRRFTPLVAEIFHLVASDVGRPIDAFNHSLRDPRVAEEARKVIATGVPFEQQVRGANETWFLLRILPYRRVTVTDGAVVTLVDITGLKRFELEARVKSDQLSSILANSPHPVWIRDRDGRYVVVDESFRKLTGRDPTGLRPEHLFSADIATMLTRDDARVLDEHVTVEAEETIPTPTGPRTYLSVKFPMRDAAGHSWGIGGIGTDVTPLKRAESAARDAADRRDHFLATLSHELRNPLAAMLNASRVLLRGPMPPAELEQWHRIILERSQHMTHLVDDLLDVARLTQNKLVLKRQQLELGATVKGVVEEVDQQFRERGVTLVTKVDPGLFVSGDATRLHQLQVNLLTNAARHAPPGSDVTYAVRRFEDAAEICVTDAGSGIAPEMLQRIFELFVQGDRPGSRGDDGGLGVGLALVRRIAELHGGTANVWSAGVGRGAEFRVRIPLVAVAPIVQAPISSPSAGPPRTVLLVDDDTGSRVAMAKLLELDDIVVSSAKNGPEALATLAEGLHPELVLLDIGLPGIDGFEVCRRMRAMPRGEALLILALTGFGQDSDREATRRAGFDGHLTKPVDVDEVFSLYARCRARLASEPRA